MLRRREFIQRAAVAATLLGIPLSRAEALGQITVENPPMPSSDLYTSDPARYWAEMRRQWLLASDYINLNCGSVGCSPLPVLRAMIEHILTAEEFREPAYPWFGYDENDHLKRNRHEARRRSADERPGTRERIFALGRESGPVRRQDKQGKHTQTSSFGGRSC